MGRRRRRNSSSDYWIPNNDPEEMERIQKDIEKTIAAFEIYKKESLRKERLWAKRNRLKRMDVELTDEEADNEEENGKSVPHADSFNNQSNRKESIRVGGKSCSVPDCKNEAEAHCTFCSSDVYFCSPHALNHNVNLHHAVRRQDGTYVGSEKPLEVDGTTRKNPSLMIMEFGWFYDRRPLKEIMADPKWFPMTTAKPSTFVFYETMQSSANQLKDDKCSIKSIMDAIEANHSMPPPKKWRYNFAEALKIYMDQQVKQRDLEL